VLFELRYGAAKSARPERNASRIDDFLAGPIEVLPFGPEDADDAVDIRAALERGGTPIGPYDYPHRRAGALPRRPSRHRERAQARPRAAVES
jgi:hypothetical protein